MKKYISICSWGGIISDVKTFEDLSLAASYIETLCEQNSFDYESDDARIFDSNGREVASYDHESGKVLLSN